MRIKSDKCDREGRYYRQTSSLGVWKIYAIDITGIVKNEDLRRFVRIYAVCENDSHTSLRFLRLPLIMMSLTVDIIVTVRRVSVTAVKCIYSSRSLLGVAE